MKPSEVKAGMRVRYHPIIGREHDGRLYEVQSVGALPGKRDVAWLKGKRGCVAVEALSLPKHCDRCGLGEAEHMACEEPDCGTLR